MIWILCKKMKNLLKNEFAWIRNKVGSWLVGKLFLKSELTRYRGISILFGGKEASSFLSTTKEAIDFIEEQNSRRFYLVQKNIKGIYPRRGGATGICRIDEKLCGIMLRKIYLYPENYRAPVYASLLIHLTTQLRISQRISFKSIYFDSTLRCRVMLLCVLEEFRFAKKILVTSPEIGNFLCQLISYKIAKYAKEIGAGKLPSWAERILAKTR